MNFRLPPITFSPSHTADKPFPGNAINSCGSIEVKLLSCPHFRTALASGCSLFCSNEYAYNSNSSIDTPSAATISVTCGSPFVIVPVLSRHTISIFPVSSSDTAVLNNIPCFAPTPFPTMIATGVASPNAHGQLITSTEMPLANAKPMLAPVSSQTTIVTSAITMTVGTNTPDTLSAILAIGAFVAAASLTI